MARLPLLLVAAFLLAQCANAAPAPAPAGGTPSAAGAALRPKKYIVRLKSASSVPTAKQRIAVMAEDINRFRAMEEGAAPRVKDEVRHDVTLGNAKFITGTFSARMVDQLKKNPEVATVEEDKPIWAYGSQPGAPWNLVRADQRQQVNLGAAYNYDDKAQGRGVDVFVVDTGIDVTHPELKGRAFRGFKAEPDWTWNDDHGHGTHVAGTIADAAVASLVADYGCNIVAAAGNESQNACDYSPGRVPSVITVASSNRDDSIRETSNYGPCVTMFAPGQDIKSLAPGGKYNVLSGTSMAAPLVSGTAAIYLSIPVYNGNSPADLKNALVRWATPNVVKGLGAYNRNAQGKAATPNLMVSTHYWW
ncbi:hypothetical protein H9P43_000580 [Blastocladiella emersonii ATCC 22665]|nr:hypothetical protein H9P43_000580 [Blastocladiella emersonii ATCC 22665]